MRFNCTAWANARHERLTNWHRWFAWHPITMKSGPCVWLEMGERKCHFSYGYGGALTTYEYRDLAPTAPSQEAPNHKRPLA